jgi:hypothetical protein
MTPGGPLHLHRPQHLPPPKHAEFLFFNFESYSGKEFFRKIF